MAYDIIGNIAIVKFPEKTSKKEKLELSRKLLDKQGIKTVLEKIEKVKGKLRTYKTKYLGGRKTLETIHKESGCLFKLNIESCYFSPRLSSERLEIASMCKRNDKVLVLFAGVAPFSIVIAKTAGCEITSVELGKECCKYARENIKLNKVVDKVKIIQGNVKKLDRLIRKTKYDKIVMPRPQLKETFLKYIWKFTKRGTEVYYYDFGKEVDSILETINKESKRAKKKIKILKVKKAGEIAPYKYRWRVEFKTI